jgi:hypothetical protein
MRKKTENRSIIVAFLGQFVLLRQERKKKSIDNQMISIFLLSRILLIKIR